MGNVSYEPLIRDITWSYSRIKSFEDCPYRWYLKYIMFPRNKGLELFFASYGSFMHELIAEYYSGKDDAAGIRLNYLSNYRNRVSRYAPNRKVARGYFDSGLNYLKGIQPSENKVVAVEERFESVIFGIPFIGFVDRLDESEDGDLILIDNKSRTLRERSNRSKPTQYDRELDEYLRQLYLYSAFIKDRFGKYPAELWFNCFRENLTIKEPFAQEKFDEAITWAKDKIEEIAVETDFRPNIEWFKCHYLCEMRELCEYFELNFT